MGISDDKQASEKTVQQSTSDEEVGAEASHTYGVEEERTELFFDFGVAGDSEDADVAEITTRAIKTATLVPEPPQVSDTPHAAEGADTSTTATAQGTSGFYPRSRKRLRLPKVLDPFMPAPPPPSTAEAATEAIATPPPPPEEAAPAFSPALAATEQMPTMQLPVAPEQSEPLPFAAAPGAVLVAPGAQPRTESAGGGPAPWVTFAVSYLLTAVVTLGIAWTVLDLGAEPKLGASDPAPAKLTTAAKADQIAPQSEAERCLNQRFWSRQDVLFHAFKLTLSTGTVVESATVQGLEDCQLKVRIGDNEHRQIPLADITRFERL